MSADSIASHGKTKGVSALSIASFGRLIGRLLFVPITALIAEVFNLVSEIQTLMRIESKIE